MAEARGYLAADRAVLRLGGVGVLDFLQNLVTNDIGGLARGAVYAALLTPQGKYLFDFFLLPDGADVLVDVQAERAAALAQKLAIYKLRAAVTIEAAGLAVVLGTGPMPAAPLAFADPRHPGLGWRAYGEDVSGLLACLAPLEPAAMTALRVAHLVPETGIELVADDSYILEMGFERLNGVDFRKGCYVGQEVTARMKHKTELKKGLARVRLEGAPPAPGTEVRAGDRVAGTLHTVADGVGLAFLRFDRAAGELTAGGARLTVELPG